MQEQIDAQQALIDALTKNLTITSIVETDEGYVITFSDNSTITVKQDSSFIENIEVEEDCITFTFADGRVVTLPLTNNDGNDGSGDSGEVVGENNKIYYTTSDGKKLFPYNTEPAAYGAVLVSNVYKDGQGVLTFDDTITSLEYQAFYECDSLTSITIPDSVTTIGVSVFANCHSLTSITIPDSVTTIGVSAFSNCHSLTSVTIPDSVTTIGDYAFSNCDSLTSVTIGDSVTTIGYEAFYGCNSLTSVTIGDSVTAIGNYAFYGCNSLTSVTIPDSETTIGKSAFAFCSSLKKVYCNATIPPSLGYDAFSYNATGRRIYVYEECVEVYKSAWINYKDSIYTNGQNCPDTTTIVYTTTDGNTITSSKLPIISNIYDNGVGTMVIAGGIIRIPKDAFYYCSRLTSVTIPDSVTTIGDEAFYGCSSLTSVTIPDSVTTIGNYAFRDCSSLTNVTIPDSVTTIGEDAFSSCSSLTNVYCKATAPPAGGSDMFYNNASGRKIYVPMESVEAYKSASGWKEYKSYIVGYNF